MISYIEWRQIVLGPLRLQVWGLFVALGVLLAAWLVARRARRAGLAVEPMLGVALWIVMGALLGARLFYVFFYAGDTFWFDPWSALAVWQGGWSALGGVVGAVSAMLIMSRWSVKVDLNNRRVWDVLAGAWPLGMAVGRLGCFFIHDHIGKPSKFFLAVNFPDGPRHDLGLYEVWGMLALAGLVPLIEPRFKRYPGGLTILLIGLYLLLRLGLDFLRADDELWAETRWWSLTPTQWFGAALLVSIIVLSGIQLRSRRKSASKI